MKTIAAVFLLFFMSLVFLRPSFARECTTDIDCDVLGNEKCIIPPNGRGGVCGKSGVPQKKELNPLPDAASPSPLKRGRFCMTSRDCEPGESCIKKETALTGVCSQ